MLQRMMIARLKSDITIIFHLPNILDGSDHHLGTHFHQKIEKDGDGLDIA